MVHGRLNGEAEASIFSLVLYGIPKNGELLEQIFTIAYSQDKHILVITKSNDPDTDKPKSRKETMSNVWHRMCHQ